jgi:peptidyl-prolyl cis-trans isomerase C
MRAVMRGLRSVPGRLPWLLGVALLLLALAGCNEKALEVSRPVDGGPPVSSLSAEQSSKVLARVGDHVITLGDYVAALEHMDQFDRLRYRSAERRKELLDEMINIELLAKEARDKGYDKDPIAQQEARGILRDAVLEQAHQGGLTPSDVPEAEVKAYYDSHRSEFTDPERRRLSAIVLRDEATANKVLELALKTTTPSQWGELVRAKSIDPSAKANVPVDLAGDFGMVSPPGDSRGANDRVPDAVRVGLFELAKPSDVLPRVVIADERFWIVRLMQKTDGHDRTYAETERGIRVKLVQDKLRQREDELLATLRVQHPVQIDESALANVHVNLADAAPPEPAPPDAGRD